MVRINMTQRMEIAQDRIDRLESVVHRCALWFREYEASHRAKVIPDFLLESQINDTVAKAERNRERAEMCERVLEDGR